MESLFTFNKVSQLSTFAQEFALVDPGFIKLKEDFSRNSYLDIVSTFLDFLRTFSLFPNSSKTTKPNELKFLGMISLGVQMVLGLKTSAFIELLAGK